MPVPCGASRETVKRSDLAGYAAYGYCASHSRWFWGFRLYLLCTPDGVPVDFCLAPANQPEREVAAAMLARRPLVPGQVLVTDKGFASAEFEQFIAQMGALLVRPDRADEAPGSGRWAGSASGSSRSTTPSRASCRWNATTAAPWPASSSASRNGSSLWPRASGSTGSSASPHGPWSPTTTEPTTRTESII